MMDDPSGGPSRLLKAWFSEAFESAGAASDDTFHAIETDDPRRAGGARLAIGGVVEGRKDRPPAVVLYGVTDEGQRGRLAVTSRDGAQAVLEALRQAWPDLGQEDEEPEDDGDGPAIEQFERWGQPT